MNYYVKQGDTAGGLVVYLEEDRNGNIPQLSGKTIRFWGWSHGSPIYDWITDRAGEVEDASVGAVRMDWQPSDTDDAGTYHLEIEVIDAEENIETFPARGSLDVQIEARKPKG